MEAANLNKDALARKLTRLGLNQWAGWLLETLAPLSIIGAQLIHVSAPVTHLFFDAHTLENAAQSLENPQTLRALATFIAHYEEPAS